MDSEVFDRLISALGRTGSRRGVVQVVAATVGLGGLSLLGIQDTSARKKRGGNGCPADPDHHHHPAAATGQPMPHRLYVS